VAAADVVIASYKPGDAEKLRVDYKTLSAINPRIVYGQITGYGLDDERAGYDAVIQAEAGFQGMNGDPSSPPTKMPVALIDVLTAHQLKEAILAGLWRRDREGGHKGSFFTVSLLSTGVSSLANQGTAYLLTGTKPKRLGSDHPSICPYGTVFTCRDGGLVTLAVGADSQFAALCHELGSPELAQDPRFATNPKRVENREECKAAVRAMIEAVDRADLLARLRARSVPVGGVNDLGDVFEQPQAEDVVVRGDGGQVQGMRQAAFVSGSDEPLPAVTLRQPPRYGEHTREILEEVAGMSSAEVDALLEQGSASEK
jgi:crotonobetainyl-CoA:carnitine CoA-transferase CaiB-like acyl-CoA transferase